MASDFLKVQRDLEDVVRPRQQHPTGWEPKLVVEGERAELVSRPVAGQDPAPGWEDELRARGGDPTRWKPSGPVRFSSWDAQVKGGDVVQMHAYRWNLVPASSLLVEDVEDLVSKIEKRRKRPPKVDLDQPRALVVCLSDWQAGKAEGGGHEALIERVLKLKQMIPDRVRQLKRAGRPIDRLYVITMGDLVEGCGGSQHYPMQDFSVELDRRQQVKLVRRLLVDLLAHWAPLAPHVVVGAVPGNHGELRVAGKAVTTFEDNDDVAVVEMASEVLQANDHAFGHVRFVIPDGDLTITLEPVPGQVIGFAHGHQARKGSTPQAKQQAWWSGKSQARHPIGDADILVTGHYHFLQVVVDGPRTWMQCPALDGGSRWFEEAGGPTTRCGTLTFTVDADGWDDLAMLR